MGVMVMVTWHRHCTALMTNKPLSHQQMSNRFMSDFRKWLIHLCQQLKICFIKKNSFGGFTNLIICLLSHYSWYKVSAIDCCSSLLHTLFAFETELSHTVHKSDMWVMAHCCWQQCRDLPLSLCTGCWQVRDNKLTVSAWVFVNQLNIVLFFSCKCSHTKRELVPLLLPPS